MFPTEAPPETADDQTPETTQAPQDQYGEDNRDLPEQLVDAIKAAITEAQGQEKFTRRKEVLHDRLNRFFERGYQHISWGAANSGFTLASPGAFITNSAGNSVQCPQYIDDYDIFGPYLWILIAILTQNPPGVNFQPTDPSVPQDIDKARAAEAYAHAFDRMNDSKEIQTDIVRMMGLSGRTVSWTRTEQDAQKFGYEADGTTPKFFQKTTIHGTLETKVPILARDLCACPYVFIMDDPDIKVAKDKYDWVADKIKANMAALGENMYERTARLGVLNGTRNQAQIGDSLTHLVSRGNYFLRPSAFTGDLYENVLDEPGSESDSGERMTVKDKLLELFPSGCHAVFVGDVYVESCDCSIDDAIDIRFPFPGDGMFRKAIMDPMVVVQDAFNDSMNATREIFDVGWPSTWVDADETEFDAIINQRAAPYAIRQKKAKAGMKTEDSFFREPNPELPATFVEYIELLRGKLPQFMLATPDAIMGQGMEDQKTASGYAQARASAMGRMGLIWSAIQHMWARIRYQSALAAAKNDAQNGQMTIPGKEGSAAISVNFDSLKKGDFGCYSDEDSSFPETTQQKRQTMGNLMTMAGQSPALMQMLDTPENVEQILRLNGLEELDFPQAEAWRKQISEIEELLKAEPLPPAPEAVTAGMVDHAAGHVAAAVGGQPEPPPMAPPPMQPTIAVDPEMDFHQWEWAAGQIWWGGDERREEEDKGNFGGLSNVRLHLLQHRVLMMAAQAAAAPPVPAGAPKGSPAGPPHNKPAPPAQTAPQTAAPAVQAAMPI